MYKKSNLDFFRNNYYLDEIIMQVIVINNYKIEKRIKNIVKY